MGKGDRSPIIIPRLELPWEATAEERDGQILLLEAAQTELDIQRTEVLGASDEKDDHKLFGYPSTIAYLKHRAGMSGSRAKRYTLLARAACIFKATFESWRQRQVSSDEAALLFQSAERTPDKYPHAEAFLREIVGDGYDDTRRILDYWRQSADEVGVEIDEQNQLIRRRFDVRRTTNGMVEGDFSLTSVAGESLMTAIDALMPPTSDHDNRTPSGRRADSLEDLSRAYLEGTETPEVGGEKPHVNVHVDMDALEGSPGGLHETETGTVLTVATIRQLACDSSITRIVWSPESAIIDIGRKTRVVPAATRRALIARDRHCVMPGCRRSARWTDAHHITHWADGGTTDLDNLCLLCRYHHTLVHADETYELLLLEHIRLAGIRRPI